jgi:hypothetical protein
MNYQRISKVFKDIASPFFVVLAEYTFAGIVLGGVLAENLPYSRTILLACGAILTALLFLLGFMLKIFNVSNHE